MLLTVLIDVLGSLSGYKEKYNSIKEQLESTQAGFDAQVRQYSELRAEKEALQAELNKALDLAQNIKKELDLWQN